MLDLVSRPQQSLSEGQIGIASPVSVPCQRLPSGWGLCIPQESAQQPWRGGLGLFHGEATQATADAKHLLIWSTPHLKNFSLGNTHGSSPEIGVHCQQDNVHKNRVQRCRYGCERGKDRERVARNVANVQRSKYQTMPHTAFSPSWDMGLGDKELSAKAGKCSMSEKNPLTHTTENRVSVTRNLHQLNHILGLVNA